MSESTTSAGPPSSALIASAEPGSRKSRRMNSTPAVGAMSRRSIATTFPLPCALPARRAATWLQPPGAAPRSTTRAPGLSRWCLSSISMSLKAARPRNPSRLARATYGSLSCRSSQSLDDSDRPLPDLTRTLRGRLLGAAFMGSPRKNPRLDRGAPCLAVPHAVLAHHLHQHAFAQPAVGDAQPLTRKCLADRVKNGATREHEVGAVGADTGIGDEIFVAPAQQALDHARHLLVHHPAAVDPAPLVAPELEMDAGDRRDRSRCPEQVHMLAVETAMFGDEIIDEGGDLGGHRGVDFTRDLVPAVALRERHHADRQRHPGFDLRQWRPASCGLGTLEPDELGGAAADVEQDDAVGAGVDQRGAAGRRQCGLGFTVDDVELEAHLAGDAGAEFVPVDGRTTCFRRDQARPADTAVAHLVAADRERRHRTVDGRVADAAGCRDPLAEPDDARERIDDAEAVAGRTSDQQPAVVGAEIERGIGRAGAMPCDLGAVLTRIAIGRAATQAGRRLRRPLMDRVEAAGCPALVLHQVPSRRAEALPSSTAAALSEPLSCQV